MAEHNTRGRRPHKQGSQGANRKEQFWRPTAELPDPEPITPAADPATLIRSLGHPPLPRQAGTAEHYLAAVVERAAGLATALAASAELLAEPPADGEPD